MAKRDLRYRLGLDLGTNSIGWALLELDDEMHPFRVLRLGVRIFDAGRKPKDGSSKAVDRRGPRQMRRRRDRYLRRRALFIDALISNGLLPQSELERKGLISLNPWRLRSEALERKLEPYEIGRALFHLQQRRGFKSNRRLDKGTDEDKEIAGLKGAINEFSAVLGGRTVGQELWLRIQRGEPARARKVGSKASERYLFYVDRGMVADEFDAIWDSQAVYYPVLMDNEAKTQVKDILLYQRPLLPQNPGTCFFERHEQRMLLALESAQLFRLYQEVNNLRLKDKVTLETRALTRAERDQAISLLLPVREMNLESLRRKLLGKQSAGEYQFTLETTNRKVIKGDQTFAALRKAGISRVQWESFSLDDRDRIAVLIATVDNERILREELSRGFGFSNELIEELNSVRLSDFHLRVGITAGRKILKQLQDGWDIEDDTPLTYDKAVIAAGYRSHSIGGDGVVYDRLPYYGEVLSQYAAPMRNSKVKDEATFGKIGNPTVHIGLNQVRKVVNALIDRYGVPAEIVIEVSRELKNGEYTKREIEKAHEENQERNKRIANYLEELGQVNTADNRTRLRLYEELGAIKQCIYSGHTISLSQLFTNEIQIDHILPLSRTLDNSFSNKILALHSANRFKGNNSPFEAFGSSPVGFDWGKILQ